jgi:hypothetical protein
MCDKTNAEEIVSEMIEYLEHADYSIREEMVSILSLMYRMCKVKELTLSILSSNGNLHLAITCIQSVIRSYLHRHTFTLLTFYSLLYFRKHRHFVSSDGPLMASSVITLILSAFIFGI